MTSSVSINADTAAAGTASAPRPTVAGSRSSGTGTRGTRVVGVLAIAMLGWLVTFGLFVSPRDATQRDAVRLFYVHVPLAELAYLAFAVTAVCCVGYLWQRTRSLTWDRVGGVSAEIGVVFTALALVSGSIWGRLTWGVFWTWDARLTTTALMFVLFLGYLAVQRIDAPADARARRAAVTGLIASANLPIVHFSVSWWRTLHQGASVAAKDTLNGTMRFTHLVGAIAFFLVYLWFMLHGNRIAMVEEVASRSELATAIAERRQERV